MNIVLIGLRGTGKTTVARLVAEKLGWPWHDADRVVEARAGKSIAELFRQEGEPVFRDLEAQVVADLAAQDQCVLALGGGAVLRAETRQAIAGQGFVVWLTASPETLWSRISTDGENTARRPNLTLAGGIDEIIATLDARRAIYGGCAHCTVDTEGRSPQQVADAIVEQLPAR